MIKEEKQKYDKYLENLASETDIIETAKEEGREERKGEERKQLILKQYSKGLSIEYIAEINDFDIEYVKSII